MTPAEKVIDEAIKWMPEMQAMAVSMKSAVAIASGYKHVFREYKDKSQPGIVFMQMRACDPEVIELETIIAYPGGQGMGTDAITALCELCDREKVIIWCEYSPYGSDRVPPSVAKLREWYTRFGFFPIQDIKEEWYTPLHAWRGFSSNLLMRNPK